MVTLNFFMSVSVTFSVTDTDFLSTIKVGDTGTVKVSLTITVTVSANVAGTL